VDSVLLANLSANGLAVSCDGTRLVTRCGTVVQGFTFNPATGLIADAALFSAGGLDARNFRLSENPVGISQDGSLAFASHLGATATEGTVRFFDAETGEPRGESEDLGEGAPTSISRANCCGDIDPPPPSDSIFEKEITGGPDRDSDGETDRVVEVLSKTTSEFEFTITFRHEELAAALIRDIVPGQWEVVSCLATNPDDVVQLSRSGRALLRGNFATQIDWYPTDNDSSLVCTVKLRLNRLAKYEPANYGKLVLNQGATALDASTKRPLLDSEGQRLTTPGLFILGMKDVNRDKQIDWSGEGDEDGDTLSDWFEATEFGTDPTKKDTDGDRSPDNIDREPLNRRKK
jgi:hypothetical protein